MELSRRTHHILVLGTCDPQYLSIADEAEILAKAASAGHLTILAHPFRFDGGADMLEARLKTDAIEHRTCNQDQAMADRSAAAAARLGMRLVNGGDVHALEAMNRFWIETASPIDRGDDIRDIILAGAYKNCISEKEK